jgi:hypothetical protein
MENALGSPPLGNSWLGSDAVPRSPAHRPDDASEAPADIP